MAETINFNRDKARQLVDCLAKGRPIEGVVNHDDMLMLAGACLFVARSHGPLPDRLQRQGAGALALQGLPAEFLVSTDEQFLEDSNSAVEFYAQLAQMMMEGEYDEQFEPKVRAFVYTEAGGKKVLPVGGFRGHDSMGG